MPINSQFRASASACAVLALSFAAFASPALAKDVNKPFFGPSTVGYGDEDGVPNKITVSSPHDSGKFRFHDDVSYAPMTFSAPCTKVDTTTVDCPADDVAQVFAIPGGDDDTVAIENTVDVPAFVLGGYGNDTISGGPGDDLVTGMWGNDYVDGGYGNDRVSDSGKLFLLFFIPPDVTTWGDGNDTLLGGPGDDWVDGGEIPEGTGAGADTLDGGSGNDTADYSHRTGPLSISQDGKSNDGEQGEGDGVGGFEKILGGSAGDHLSADDHGNTLVGAVGDDVLTGGAGHDVLYGGSADDPTGSGNDTLDGGLGYDRLSGGDGYDVATYESRTDAVTASLDDVANDGAPGEADNVLRDIEELRGGAAGDTLTGSGGADALLGLGGADTVRGAGGDDTVRGGDAGDTIYGGSGDDTLHGGAGDDTITGGSGDDKIDCGDGDDTVHAGRGDVVAADCEHVDGLPAAATGTPSGNPGSSDGTPQPPAGGPGTGAAHGPRVTVGPKRIRFDRRGRAKLRIGCPAGTPGGCLGVVTLSRNGKLVSAHFKVAAGKHKRVRVHLTKRGKRALRHSLRLRAKVSARASDSRGWAATAHGKVTLLGTR